MSDSTRERLDLTQWAVDNHQDPAIKVSLRLIIVTGTSVLMTRIELCVNPQEPPDHAFTGQDIHWR